MQCDEFMAGKKAKNHRGTGKQKFWTFVIVQEAGKRCYFETVPNRTFETLTNILLKRVPKSCTIYHDDYPSYRNLHTIGYNHETVVHKNEFVTAAGVHTNKAEGLIGLLRQRITRMHGLYNCRTQLIMDEFAYRMSFGENGNIWKALGTDLKKRLNF